MLSFFSVPPFKRQAAGPLTENLPNVFSSHSGTAGFGPTGDPCRVAMLLDTPSSRGTKRRLLSRPLYCAPWAPLFLPGDVFRLRDLRPKGATFA